GTGDQREDGYVASAPLPRGCLTPADHANYLHPVALAQGHRFVGGALDDLAVVLHGHGARVHTQLVEIGEQRRRVLELNVLAVNLQRDHSKSRIAAPPPAPAPPPPPPP